MSIVACIKYEDQGAFILDGDKNVWRMWIDPIDRLPLFEQSIDRDIPASVTTYFKQIWPEY